MTCTRCHQDKDCSIHCRRLNKDGTTYTRYICRECRRRRAKPVLSPTPKAPLRFNWGLDYNAPSPSPIVSMPPPVRYTTAMAKFVAEGRQKNHGIMLKYK